LLKPLETANLTISVVPTARTAPSLAQCGLCGRDTYITLTLSDDHPSCCRHCFRQRVSQVRGAQRRTR
jgi:hypothetical protein